MIDDRGCGLVPGMKLPLAPIEESEVAFESTSGGGANTDSESDSGPESVGGMGLGLGCVAKTSVRRAQHTLGKAATG